jgi:hypothetical protein
MLERMQLSDLNDGTENILIGNDDIILQPLLTITSDYPALDPAILPNFYGNLQLFSAIVRPA